MPSCAYTAPPSRVAYLSSHVWCNPYCNQCLWRTRGGGGRVVVVVGRGSHLFASECSLDMSGLPKPTCILNEHAKQNNKRWSHNRVTTCKPTKAKTLKRLSLIPYTFHVWANQITERNNSICFARFKSCQWNWLYNLLPLGLPSVAVLSPRWIET